MSVALNRAFGAVAAGAFLLAAQAASAQSVTRANIAEESIAGQYAFSGPVNCLSSTTGFNADFTPTSPTQGGPSAFIQVSHGISTGVRTFNADGTGTLEVYTQTVSGPGIFYGFFAVPTPPPAPGFPPPTGGPTFSFSAGVATNGGAPRPSGTATGARTSGPFTWQMVDGQLLIQDSDSNGGTLVEGPGAGNAVSIRGLPALVGILGKDRRTISTTQERVQVETALTVLPDGTVRETPRICVRERLLRKL